MKQKKILHLQEYELPIVIQEDKAGGFVALCPLWKDAYAQGDTIEEVVSEIGNVVSSLIELYKEENITIPLKLKKSSQKASTGFNLNIPIIVSQ